MADLLLELGCEELPASFVRKAVSDLSDRVMDGLREANVLDESASVTTFCTPRRLIVGVSGLIAQQPDSVKESRGPAIRAAYDADGNPTGALQGFCRGQGVDVSEVRNDGQYVWVTKPIPGRPTLDLLPDVLADSIRKLTFEKSMRWGSGRMRFARPIRWILAALDGQVIPFEIEGVVSGLLSRGHRFYAPDSFPAPTLADLESGLRARFVEPDPARREAEILITAGQRASGAPDLPAALVDENVFLTEWPTVIAGSFSESFLELPEPVLVTAMAKHEKMFPVRDAQGQLTNEFLFVRNAGEDESVTRGCQWVLNARFNDAQFFYEEDRRYTMDDFLARTETLVYQDKLGSVRARADRLAQLAQSIARSTAGSAEEVELAYQAGLYAKADLATGLVGELASLQGIIGDEYVAREAFSTAVCRAIAAQYASESADDRLSLTLIMADQLDKLAGYLGQGLEPSGSSDPFGLRRAVTILIDVANRWPGELPPYDALLVMALDTYRTQDIALDHEAARRAMATIFASRYPALRPEVRFDIMNAAVNADQFLRVTDPVDVAFRISLLERLAPNREFIQTASRPLNLVASAVKKGIRFQTEDPLSGVQESALGTATGTHLCDAVREATRIQGAIAGRDLDRAETYLLGLQAPINAYIDGVMIMSEDPQERYSRLSLMQAVADVLHQAGDLDQIVIDGS